MLCRAWLPLAIDLTQEAWLLGLSLHDSQGGAVISPWMAACALKRSGRDALRDVGHDGQAVLGTRGDGAQDGLLVGGRAGHDGVKDIGVPSPLVSQVGRATCEEDVGGSAAQRASAPDDESRGDQNEARRSGLCAAGHSSRIVGSRWQAARSASASIRLSVSPQASVDNLSRRGQKTRAEQGA